MARASQVTQAVAGQTSVCPKLLCLTLLLLTPLQAGETLLSKQKLQPGLYVWDGLSADSGAGALLATHVATLDAAGFHAVRLLLSPASQRSYSLPPLRCAGGPRSLNCLFLSDAYQRALTVKTLQV